MLTRKLDMDVSERDHRVYRLLVDGQLVVQTKVSRGSGADTLGHDLEQVMARQLHVPVRFFRELVECTKQRDDYLGHLREAGVL